MRTAVIKRTLLLALLFATSSAQAGWVLVGQVDSINIYIDPETIRKDGNLVRVWEIQDLKQRDKDGRLSTRVRSEYDCKQDRRRTLLLSYHSESMAGGKTLLSVYESGNWLDIPPDTAGSGIQKIVCAR